MKLVTTVLLTTEDEISVGPGGAYSNIGDFINSRLKEAVSNYEYAVEHDVSEKTQPQNVSFTIDDAGWALLLKMYGSKRKAA